MGNESSPIDPPIVAPLEFELVKLNGCIGVAEVIVAHGMLRANYLDLSWRLILVFGLFNILFAIIVPLLSHLLFPRPFLFVSEDERFAGVYWSDILLLNQRLGLWILLLMDTGRGMMMGLGILVVFLAWMGVRTGERWALTAVLLSGLLSGAYSWTVTFLYIREGLYNGFSGVSLGVWMSILLYAPWGLGLLFGGIGSRRGERDQGAETSQIRATEKTQISA